MTLIAVLEAIEPAGRPLTPSEVAARTGIAPERVRGMLAALRANGRLAPAGPAGSPPDGCAGAASCGAACLGPGDCPLVIDLGPPGLSRR